MATMSVAPCVVMCHRRDSPYSSIATHGKELRRLANGVRRLCSVRHAELSSRAAPLPVWLALSLTRCAVLLTSAGSRLCNPGGLSVMAWRKPLELLNHNFNGAWTKNLLSFWHLLCSAWRQALPAPQALLVKRARLPRLST